MSAVYSKRLLMILNGAASASAVVPAGKVWVIRSAHLAERGVAASVHEAYLTGAGCFFLAGHGAASGAGTLVRFDGYFVLNAGEQLSFVWVNGNWDAQASGYELSV